MAFYKLCDCGHKNRFEHRGQSPRKCEECGRSLLEFSVIDEDIEEDIPETDENTISTKDDLELDSFYYSLDAVDGSGTIKVPPSGGVIGRAYLGSNILESHHAVSREHIKVSYRGRIGLLIEDKSKFGTFINGEQMVKGSTRFARDGDVIKLYDFELVVHRHECEED